MPVAAVAGTTGAGVVCAAPGMPDEPAFERLLELNHAAVNGSVDGLDLRLEMREPGDVFDLRIRIARPDRLRADLYRFGLSVYSEGSGSRGPWEQTLVARRSRAPSAAGAAAMRSGVEWLAGLRSVRELRDRGARVSPLASRLPPPHHCLPGVRVALATGVVRDVYLDPRTHLPARARQTVAQHPDRDGPNARSRDLEIVYEEYRRVGGAALPMRTVSHDLRTSEWVQTVRIRSATPASIPPDVFESR